jgi:hypothetical protein
LSQSDDGPDSCHHRCSRACSHRAASSGDLSSGRGSRCLCTLELGSESRRGSALDDTRRHSGHTLGDDPDLSQVQTRSARQTPRSQVRASRLAASHARGHRPARRSSTRILPPMPRAIDSHQSDAEPSHRGHPRSHHNRRHRAHDPSRLVPALPQGRRAGGARGLARGHARQPHAGPLGLAALRPGKHPLADRRRLQPPPDDEGHTRRPDPDVVPPPGDPLRLVSGDPGPGIGLRGPARRRDRLAGRRQDPLALVLRDDRSDLLPDRSQPGQPGAVGILQGRVRRDVGDRLLWSLQQGRLRVVRSAWCTCFAS